METTAHGKVFINGVEAIFRVAFWNNLQRRRRSAMQQFESNMAQEDITYAEELNVVQNLIVEGKVVAGNKVNAGLLLNLPVLETESLALAQELIPRELAAPVSLSSLLQVTKASHTRETKNGAGEIVSIEGFSTQNNEPTNDVDEGQLTYD